MLSAIPPRPTTRWLLICTQKRKGYHCYWTQLLAVNGDDNNKGEPEEVDEDEDDDHDNDDEEDGVNERKLMAN